MNASETKNWLEFFAKVGIVYERMVHSWWSTFPHHGSDSYESLRIFLSDYAFERQGGSFYAPFACEALKQAGPDFLDASIVWDKFRNEIEKWKRHNQDTELLRMNESRNPLAPKGTTFTIKSRNGQAIREEQTTKKSIIEFANKIGLPLIDWAHIKLQSETRLAYDGLCEISGIGPKIASYFLRDVARQFNCFHDDTSNRHLLQPIDIWTRRAAESLSGRKFSEYDAEPAAKFIVDESLNADLSPERVNQGMWYFGAEIAETEYYLNRLFTDPEGSKRAFDDLRKHLQSLQSAASLLGNLDSPPEV